MATHKGKKRCLGLMAMQVHQSKRKAKAMEYRVVQALMVLAFQDNHYAATTIPKGQIIEVMGPVPEDDRFLMVKFNDELFHAFASDLEERGRPYQPKARKDNQHNDTAAD